MDFSLKNDVTSYIILLYLTKYFEEVKQKKLNIYKRLENERNKLNSAKKSVNAAKENQKSSLEKKKEALKTPKSKNKIGNKKRNQWKKIADNNVKKIVPDIT